METNASAVTYPSQESNVEKYHLISKDDHIKGDWWVWHCQKELLDGSLINGMIQGDGSGNSYAPETFEADEP
jgi:hypothetical protein